jgi:ribonucleoside-diphosphate reductase beta chain
LFKTGNIRTLTKEELLNFVKDRLNLKLQELGYEKIFEINKELLQNISWFGSLSSGREFGDFFATRVSEYSQNKINPNELW